MLGQPKYKKGDIVKIRFEKPDRVIERVGYVYIVDAYGTFGQSEEPSYDVMVDMDKCLYKHIPESNVSPVTRVTVDKLQ